MAINRSARRGALRPTWRVRCVDGSAGVKYPTRAQAEIEAAEWGDGATVEQVAARDRGGMFRRGRG